MVGLEDVEEKRCQLGSRVVGEVTLSITRSWVQNLSLPDERSNRETSRRNGFYRVYLVSLQGLPFTLLLSILVRLTMISVFQFLTKTSLFYMNMFQFSLVILLITKPSEIYVNHAPKMLKPKTLNIIAKE